MAEFLSQTSKEAFLGVSIGNNNSNNMNVIEEGLENKINTRTLIIKNVFDEDTRRKKLFLFISIIVIITSRIQTF
jgi:hypothetical protein